MDSVTLERLSLTGRVAVPADTERWRLFDDGLRATGGDVEVRAASDMLRFPPLVLRGDVVPSASLKVREAKHGGDTTSHTCRSVCSF